MNLTRLAFDLIFPQRMEEFRAACENGDLSIVSEILDETTITFIKQKLLDWNANPRDEGTPLHLAAENGHRAVVNRLLAERYCNINALTSSDQTPLSLAAYHGRTDVVEILLARNCHIDLTPIGRDTALHWASGNGHVDVVMLLLEYGCDANMPIGGNDTRTPLHLACLSGHVSVVKLLLELAGDVDSLTFGNSTPFVWACTEGHTEIAELLIDKHCDVNLAENAKTTAPIHHAALSGSTDILALLLRGRNEGAPCRDKCHPNCVNICNKQVKDSEGRTALHLAAEAGKAGAVRLLLKVCEVDEPDSSFNTPLHLACLGGHTEVIKVLVEEGQADIHLEGSGGRSPLYISAINEDRNEDATNYLLQKGAMFTPKYLALALNSGEKSLSKKILRSGHLTFDERFLMIVSGSTHSELRLRLFKYFILPHLKKSSKIPNFLKLLAFAFLSLAFLVCNPSLWYFGLFIPIAIGKIIQLRKSETRSTTNLGLACKNNLIEIVKELIKSGNVDDINAGIPTPIWHASNEGHVDVVNFLIRQKRAVIDFDKRAPDGTSPLMMVLTKGHKHLLTSFEKLYGSSFKILLACIRFGRHDMVTDSLKENVDLNVDKIGDLLEAALFTDNIETFDFVLNMARDYFRLTIEEISELKTIAEKRFCYDIRKKLEANLQCPDSFLVKLTKNYPEFNDEIEESWTKNWNPERGPILSSSINDIPMLSSNIDISNNILDKVKDPFCCISYEEEKINDKTRDAVSHVTFRECFDLCQQKEDCQVVSEIIKVCQKLEQNMNNDSAISFLKPKLFLKGSIKEETRMGLATEADMTLKFTRLDDCPFRLGDDATQILVPEDEETKTFFQQFCSEGCVLDYSKFFAFLMDTIQKCLPEDTYPNIELMPKRFEQCGHCKNRSEERSSLCSPTTHCKMCAPAVTLTKMGPCLIFKRKYRRENMDDKIFFIVDLIPVYPVNEFDCLVLHKKVIFTLTEKRPPSWLKYYNSLMKQDVILSEAFADNSKQTAERKTKKTKLYVGLKFFHYGPEPNYIIRPGQEIRTDAFKTQPLLKKIYIVMKATKDLLGVDVKSYQLKKVVLQSDFIDKTKVHRDQFERLLLEALSYPDLKNLFEEKIDFIEWKQTIDLQEGNTFTSSTRVSVIPLKNSRPKQSFKNVL